MFKIRIPFLIIFIVYSIKFGSANDEYRQFLDFLNFEKMKIDILTLNRTAVFDVNGSTHSDQDCLTELDKIRNGLKRMELWAIKRMGCAEVYTK